MTWLVPLREQRHGRIAVLIRRLFFTILVGLVCSAATASQTLTLSLETPSLDAPSSSAKSAPPKATKAPAPKDTNVRIGHVGLVTAAVASIYQSRSQSSRLYARVKAETPLAVVREEGQWLGVMMVNGATGWIPADCVKLIGYDLVAKKPEANRSTVPSRGTPTSRGGLMDSDIIRTAMGYAGVSYVYGGTSPVTGMDCSAFLRSVFSQYGVKLPRTAREQAQVGVSVSFDQLQPGDRLYFACKNTYPDHCGVYAGGGYFVHCSSRKKGVAVDSLSDSFFARSLVAAKRS